MTDEPSCVCLGVKAALTTALRGRPQPDCSDHPRTDEGERQVAAMPLNRNSDLKIAVLANLSPKEPTE